MNKKIRRLSFGLAVLLFLQGFALSAAESDAPAEPQPTAVQETVMPAPEPANAEVSSEKTVEPTAMETPAPSAAPAHNASPDPAQESGATEEPEEMPSVPSETTEHPEAAQTPVTEATPAPSGEATAEPSPKATEDSDTEVTAEPSTEPTQEPSAEPSDEATLEPSAEPSGEPKQEPSDEPTQDPSEDPSGEATPEPSAEPTQDPSGEPSAEPTQDPSAEPSDEATLEPSVEPTLDPSAEPAPSEEPVYSCGLLEHVHGETCYDEGPNLICELPEHTHDEACVPLSTPTPLPEEEDQSPEDVPSDGELIIAARVDERLWRGVKPSDERGMAVPMLFQGDYAQTVCTVGGIERSVATSGCGATSLSMVIAYLTGNTDQNPYTLFCDSVDAGRYHGSGWSHGTLSLFAENYGVHSRWIANDADAILSALREGKPVIAHMGPGIFTSRGHYLVLRGVTEDGLVLMNDPNSRDNCAKAFPIDTLLKQAKTSEAFMVCWSDDMSENEVLAAPEDERRKLRGDLNGSGSVDINDVQMLYNLLLEGSADEMCDFNGDGAVDQADLDALLDAILNPEAALPEEDEGGDLA